ncbi:glycoside hydrolase family 2 TIM barrel-domain containing protein [Abditibacterium utsteinense]|uniref:glycoside hydrolase family 2 TIM barrel-domain containing protein n=1 Tax=Abditibacterium utsteinense TaxID=1960156 RepID=UPI001EE6E974|nr:glycoside hydrolase family 2 TIM barrel-domain containing protein [Abditibacterium utsteinense]
MLFSHPIPVVQADATQTLYLSGTDKDHTVPWGFQVSTGRNSGKWTTIPVPSNWETKGFGNYTTGEARKSSEDGLYRFSFVPPANWRGKSVDLVFEGAMTDTSVKINGASAGPTHQGGFYRFKYDVTGLLQLGKPNLLEAMISKVSADNSVNRAEQQGDYWAFGGIYRPVYLEVKPAQHLERMAINARADGSFAADVFLNGVTDADTLSAQIQSLDGKAVGPAFSVRLPRGLANGARVPISTKIANPRLWTAETPNLYQVELKLKRGRREVHRVVQRFGFRTVEVRAGDGIYVNGRKIMLKGTNRHAFWPDSGRTTSAAIDRMDILLLKEMNMNAVRMSHYPPDQHFLDLCDELGLYVLDEIAGWQKKYDTPIGLKIVEETVVRDVNHPSILFWDNGNEGGWNTDLDDKYALFDPQKRTVLHPWSLFNDMQTGHYKTYRGTESLLDDNDIFLPTEFLHGLYDGGAGAGLDDYWNLMLKQPRAAGGFIWAFLDEGLVRSDQNGALDLYGNHFPDGIVGPYRQKEGSFYTIKDIWSPIQLGSRNYYETMFPANFNGQVSLLNHNSFTDASQCRFSWQLVNFQSPGAKQSGHTIVARGNAPSPSIAPGASGNLKLNLPANWRNSDALMLSVFDPSGREISAWNWPIKRAADFATRIVPADSNAAPPVLANEDAQLVTLTAGATQITISKTTGRIAGVKRGGAEFAFANGPALTAAVTTASEVKKASPERIPAPAKSEFVGLTRSQDGASQVVQATYSGNLKFVRYKLAPSGWLELSYAYNLTGPQDYMGVSFDFPEKQVTGVKWLGVGPYRVWKNRMRGGSLDVWSKAYNDTATGADTWNYPEFKGYYAKTTWAQLQTTQGPITMVTPDENLFLRLYTPRNGPDPRGSQAAFPGGDISWMDGIAPIGNKFHEAEVNGPQSGPNEAKGDYAHTIHLFFGTLNAPTR